ncbi:hypothetical protein KJ865_16210, partial [Myxococcota bacterium]|nr:hypothetical protein [Myxococcota bacterium]
TVSSSTPMKFYGSFNGKIHMGKLQFQWMFPFIGFPGFSSNLSKSNSIMSWPLNQNSSLASIATSNFNYLDRMAALKYKDSFLHGKLGFDAKAYITQYIRDMDPAVVLPFTEGTMNGLGFRTKLRAQRAGLTLDFNYNLGKRTRILFGGETFYEWLNNANFELVAPLDPLGNTDFSSIPLSCPYNGSPNYDPNNPQNTTFVPGCKQPFFFDQSRLVLGTFASLQHKFQNNIIVDAGLRVQTAPSGNVTYDPQFLPGLSLVVPLKSSWFWKINYLTGFRPPIFANTGANGRGVNYASDENIKVESSQAIQTEINAVLIKNMGKIQELSFRLNYGYTMVKDFIRINQGAYYNSGPRQIHSVEGLARLYLRGGHNVLMGYSFNYNIASGLNDGGLIRAVPNQWFTFASVFRLTKKLDFISSLRIIGAYEDPNRVANAAVNSSKQSWLAMELIPSAGILSAGIRYKTTVARRRAEFSLMTYNLMDTRSYYTADYFQDMAATTETVPTKGQRFYFFANSKFYF